MALSCGKISANAMLAKCGAVTPAVKGRIVFINQDDIDYEASTVTGGVISAIVTKSNAKGYKWETADRGVETAPAMVAGAYFNNMEHSLTFRVFDKTQDIKDQLNALMNSRVVAIVENRSNNNPETHFEVFGWNGGLIMTSLEGPSTDTDGVNYVVTLNNGEDARESQLPLSFYTGSVAETETALNALVTAA